MIKKFFIGLIFFILFILVNPGCVTCNDDYHSNDSGNNDDQHSPWGNDPHKWDTPHPR